MSSGRSSLEVWKHRRELEELRRECEEKEEQQEELTHDRFKESCVCFFFMFKIRITAHSPEITEQRLLLNQKLKRLQYLEFHAQHF